MASRNKNEEIDNCICNVSNQTYRLLTQCGNLNNVGELHREKSKKHNAIDLKVDRFINKHITRRASCSANLFSAPEKHNQFISASSFTNIWAKRRHSHTGIFSQPNLGKKLAQVNASKLRRRSVICLEADKPQIHVALQSCEERNQSAVGAGLQVVQEATSTQGLPVFSSTKPFDFGDSSDEIGERCIDFTTNAFPLSSDYIPDGKTRKRLALQNNAFFNSDTERKDKNTYCSADQWTNEPCSSYKICDDKDIHSKSLVVNDVIDIGDETVVSPKDKKEIISSVEGTLPVDGEITSALVQNCKRLEDEKVLSYSHKNIVDLLVSKDTDSQYCNNSSEVEQVKELLLSKSVSFATAEELKLKSSQMVKYKSVSLGLLPPLRHRRKAVSCLPVFELSQHLTEACGEIGSDVGDPKYGNEEFKVNNCKQSPKLERSSFYLKNEKEVMEDDIKSFCLPVFLAFAALPSSAPQHCQRFNFMNFWMV